MVKGRASWNTLNYSKHKLTDDDVPGLQLFQVGNVTKCYKRRLFLRKCLDGEAYKKPMNSFFGTLTLEKVFSACSEGFFWNISASQPFLRSPSGTQKLCGGEAYQTP